MEDVAIFVEKGIVKKIKSSKKLRIPKGWEVCNLKNILPIPVL